MNFGTQRSLDRVKGLPIKRTLRATNMALLHLFMQSAWCNDPYHVRLRVVFSFPWRHPRLAMRTSVHEANIQRADISSAYGETSEVENHVHHYFCKVVKKLSVRVQTY